MDTTEIIAEMFLKDYQTTWDGEAENWSQITILSDFLVWLDQRKTGGQLIDLRLIKNQTAKAVVYFSTGISLHEHRRLPPTLVPVFKIELIPPLECFVSAKADDKGHQMQRKRIP